MRKIRRIKTNEYEIPLTTEYLVYRISLSTTFDTEIRVTINSTNLSIFVTTEYVRRLLNCISSSNKIKMFSKHCLHTRDTGRFKDQIQYGM